jgi:hypothetical protein
MFEEETVDRYFELALESISEGASIQQIEYQLKAYEEEELYLECAGIKHAINYSRFHTLYYMYKELENERPNIRLRSRDL